MDTDTIDTNGVGEAGAIFGLAAWLTTRDEVVVLSRNHNAARIAELCGEYCRAQGWEVDDSRYPQNLKPMGSEFNIALVGDSLSPYAPGGAD